MSTGAGFDFVYSSDLLRATQTASVLATALGVPPARVRARAGLRERDVGAALAGLTRSEAPRAAPEAGRALGSADPEAEIPGGGESMGQLQRRVAAALEEIAAEHPGGRGKASPRPNARLDPPSSGLPPFPVALV